MLDPLILPNWKAGFLVGIDLFDINTHNYFHRTVPHMDIPLIGQDPITLLPDHMAGLLATACESVKTHTEGLLMFFRSSVTARKTACGSAYHGDLFL